MKRSRQGTASKGQLTSGLRTGSQPKRGQKSLFTEVQFQQRDGAITPATTSRISSAYGESSLEDISESEEMTSGRDSKRKLPTTVAKMPSMLSRETTSFSVFSNLAAHNRLTKHGASKVEGESSAMTNRGQQTQLLKSLKDNDVKQVAKILKSDANMNLNSADENGQTPLHVAAFRGLEHPAYMLLQAGADINLQNMVTGYTALHEAVSNGQSHMVEFLLCCGANQSIQTKAGFTALDISKDTSFSTEFEALVDLVNKGRMELASIGQSISRFKFVGVVIEPRKIVQPTSVVCRKRGVSGNTSVTIDKREEIVSDEFSLRLGTTESGYHVWVTLPIKSGKNSSSEEVVVKTADGQEINTSDVWQGKEGLLCKFSTVLHVESTFLVVCRPRTEQLAVGRGASVVSSHIDPKVKVRIGKGSFSRNTHISLRVLEIEEDTEVDDGEIMSSTPFYKMDSSEPLAKSIDVELPEPLQYGAEPCVTVVLTHHVFKGNWMAVDTVKRVGKDQTSVLFPISNLPVDAVVVKCKKGCSASSVSGEVQKTFDQLTNQAIKVCFLCLAKRLHADNVVRVVLECCKATHIDSRRRFWSSKGFVEQQERTRIDLFHIVPNQSFSITFYKNILLKEGRQNYILQFHPKRYNVVQFDVLVNDENSQSGRVYVYPNKDEIDGSHSETEADLLTSIGVSLDAKALEGLSNLNVTSSKKKTSHDDIGAKIGGKGKNRNSPSDYSLKRKTDKPTAGQDSEAESEAVTYFLTDEFLDTLVDQMEEDWYKIFVLMGIPFSDIDEALMRDASPATCKLRMLKEWRDGEKGREDLGLPLLLSALFKGGRRDVANTVQIELRDWYNTPENKTKKLYAWLCRAYQNSDLFVPTAYPSPMSDSYLVLMADELVPSREMGVTLGLLDFDIDEIVECSHYIYPGIKVMKMLTLFRGAIPSKLNALEKLVGCLEKLNYDKLRNYAVMCAKAWVKRTATRRDDPLRTQVDTLMKQLQELHVSSPDA